MGSMQLWSPPIPSDVVVSFGSESLFDNEKRFETA